MPAILYPHPPLVGEGFVLRRFRARDFNAAVAARADPEAARWVNAIAFAAGSVMARYLEAQRRRGTLLHFAIVDPAHPPRSSTASRSRAPTTPSRTSRSDGD